jgi:hypothetical protein
MTCAINFHARYNQLTPLLLLFNLSLVLEREMFTSRLSIFTPKCDQQRCSFERETADVVKCTLRIGGVYQRTRKRNDRQSSSR